MPIYEYMCEECRNNFEVLLSTNDTPVKECLHCKSTKIKKLISNCSFQLKGTGWYLTDYARKDSPKETDKQKGPEEKPKASETKSSAEKKPEKKDPGKAA